MPDLQKRAVAAARPVAGYIGGKKQLARRLAEQIDATPHGLYAEVFAGMAGVFFRRRLAPRVEVLNDVSRDVATLFRVLQNHYQALLDMLKWQLASREEWERLNGQDPERLTDLQRAARFLYVQKQTFGGKVVGRSFGIDRHGPPRFDITALAPALADVHERLAGVWIECLPWPDLLDRWDLPEALFFLDPPYWGSEHVYGRGLFEPADYMALRDRLKGLRGAFIMTLNDVPEIREMFGDFEIEPVGVTYTVQGGKGKRMCELIITNRRR
jgi:DNA adenine methylase